MNPRNTLILTVIIIVIVLAGLYFFVRHQAGTPSTSGATATSTASTASSTNQVALAQPDPSKPIIFSSDVTPEIQTELNQELAQAQAEIETNPLNMGAWTDLGTIHKQGGDYANAILYWDYVTSVYQGGGSPYYSLGDLYQNFLHDNAKAETNYLLAIKADAQNVNAYASLATLYQSEDESAKATAIITQGLQANPGNTYLESFQSGQ